MQQKDLFNKKKLSMKNNVQFFIVLTTIFVLGLSRTQAQTASAVRLDATGKVSNTIIYNNPDAKPVPNGVPVEHSLSDSVLVGVGNISSLTATPFSSAYRIDKNSPAYNAGRNSDLRASDTLDLAYSSRISDYTSDIGAYEHEVIRSCEIKTKVDTLLCPGEPYRLLVDMTSSTTDFKKWVVAGTSTEYANAAIVRPVVETSYVAIGEANDGSGETCSDTLTIRIHKTEVLAMPTKKVCEATEVTLSSTPSTGVKWITLSGDSVGSGNTTLMPPQNATTLYVAVLDDGICIDRDTVKVYVNPPDIQAFATDTTVCEGEPVHLTTNVEVELVLWTDKATGATLLEDPTVYPTTSSVYEAWVYDPICGDVSVEVAVNVRPKPVFAVNMPDTAFCKGDEFTLTSTLDASYWTLLDGTRLAQTTITADTSETYIAIYEDSDGVCKVTDTVITDVETLVLTVREDTTITQGESVELWSTPTASLWIDSRSEDTLTSLTVIPQDTTVYVAVLRSSRCEVQDTVWVYVEKVDTFFLEAYSGIDCYDNDGWAFVKVHGNTGPYTYLWSNASTESDIFDLPAGATYSVMVTDASGKTQFATTTIPDGSPLRISYSMVSPDNETCDGGRIIANVTGGTPKSDSTYNYLWHDGYTSDANGSRFNIESGAYRLTVMDDRGCEAKADINLICTYKRVMPTLYISPNGDGDNDFLKIKYIERYPLNTVTIINSYGDEIIKHVNYNNEDIIWNGRNASDRILPDGVYYYVVEAKDIDPMAGWLLMEVSKK